MTRVLIVDDRPENLYILRVLLSAHGYEVMEARHGAEALTLARQSPPELIISDLFMPVMDGYTLLRHWKADDRLKGIPFVVYTATYTEPRDERLALDLGADAFILKPAVPHVFMESIEAVLAQAERGDLSPAHEPAGDDAVQLKEYSEVLVRKLEESNSALRADIAERKRVEAALRESEERFASAFHTSPAAITITRIADGKFVDVNQAFMDLFEFRRDEVIGHTSTELKILSVAERSRLIRKQLNTGGLQDAGLLAYSKSGTPVNLLFSSKVMELAGEMHHVTTLIDITARKRAEELLQAQHAELENLYATTPVGLALMDRNLRFVRINERLAAINGKPVAAHLGRTIKEVLPELTPDLLPIYRRVLDRGESVLNVEIHGETPAEPGVPRDWLASYHPLYAADGSVSGISIAVMEITGQKQAEATLRASEERLRLFIEHAPAALAMFDREMRYLAVSRRWQEEYIPHTQSVLGQSHYDIYPDLPERWKEVHRRCLAGEIVRADVDRYERADGSVHWVSWEVRPWHTHDGSIGGIVMMSEDITKRKEAEAVARESERNLMEAQRIAQVGSWSWDLTGPVQWSDELYRIYGVSPEGFTPTIESFFDLLYPEDRPAMQEWLRACGAGESPADFEFRAVRPDGTVRFISGRGELVCDAGGRPIRMTGTAQDVTERKQAEVALHAKTEELRSLASRLQAIREEERTAIAREIHDVLAQELTRLKIDIAWINKRMTAPLDESTRGRIIDKLKDVSAQTDTAIRSVQKIATELRPVVLDTLGLAAAIEWQVEDFEKRTDIRCRVAVPGHDPQLNRDQATACFRILQESLTNVSRHAQATEVDVTLGEENGQLLLTINDNGRGIPPEKLHDPHSIGLVGMRERALSFGGTIALTGSPGGGVTVTLRIPLQVSAA